TRTGTLEIATDASTALDFVTLLGTSGAAPLTLSPTALDFGTVNIGSSGTLAVTISNVSSSPVMLTALSGSGDFAAAYGNCPSAGSALAAGASCVLQVTFTPTVAGTRTGTLSLSTNATTLPLTVALTGNAVVAKLQITPGALAFGTIAVGAPANLSLTLLNSGSAPVTGIGIASSGANAADFAVTVPCSVTTLQPGQGCAVTVTFTPSAVGARSATLSVASSDPSSPATIPLTGSGSAPGSFTLTVNGGPSATVTVKSGSPANYPLSVTPVNGFTGAVALTCAPINPGTYASCSINPSTVTLNGGAQSSTVTINTITSASLERRPFERATVFLALLGLPLLLVRRARRIRRTFLLVVLGVLASGGLVGCGGGIAPVASTTRFTPAGSYQYQVTATSTSGAQIMQTVTLNLIVQ
ncbi:MAG: choice-of-anchor D domain-containing protein, partial [Acidobacteriota bacterium]|nr:choice-of-anchor D domain-containing protein [Acidobacteriota bacterium]